MSLEGFKPVSNEVLGSLVSRVTPESVPFTKGIVALNVRFKAHGVQTRNGLSKTSSIPSRYKITGGGVLSLPNSNNLQIPLFFGTQTQAEFLLDSSLPATVGYYETPCGSGLTQVFYTSTGFDIFIDMTTAYSRAFICGVTRPTAFLGGTTYGKQYSSIAQYDGSNTYSVTLEPQNLPIGSITQSASAGNVDVGTRYAVVLFQDRFGTIHGVTDAAITSYAASDGLHQVTISSIPFYNIDGLITKRIVAFTTAGSTQAGPYYYISDNDTVGTVSITKTVIDDPQTTTTATFNFTDEYLQGSSSISSPVDFFDKIKLPQQGSVYFSPSNRRVIWCNGFDDATIFRVSEQDDPGTYLGTTGFIKPSQNDGEMAICAREFRSQLYLFKETAGFLVYNDAANPSDWTVEKRWERVGPVGPWAVDANEMFLVFLDHSGVYLMDGSIPSCISEEISSVDSTIWQRINFNVKQKFWVYIDTDLDEIHVGVALDNESDVNCILRCNYLDGIGPGKRKWSFDTLTTSRMIEVQRTLPDSPNPQTPLDSRMKNIQILHLSSQYDGQINLVDPISYSDNGNGINSIYQTGYYEQEGISQIGGVGLNARGQGFLQVSILKNQNSRKTLTRLLPENNEVMGEVIKTSGQNPWFSLEFSNNSTPGSWFEVTRCDLYLRLMWKTRRTKS